MEINLDLRRRDFLLILIANTTLMFYMLYSAPGPVTLCGTFECWFDSIYPSIFYSLIVGTLSAITYLLARLLTSIKRAKIAALIPLLLHASILHLIAIGMIITTLI